MATEDEQMATQLLRTGATVPEQQQALCWLADYCEESYILNLPPASKVLQALDRFSRRAQADPTLKRHSAKLYKQYKLR